MITEEEMGRRAEPVIQKAKSALAAFIDATNDAERGAAVNQLTSLFRNALFRGYVLQAVFEETFTGHPHEAQLRTELDKARAKFPLPGE